MRWRDKFTDTTRERSGFLLFPRTIDGETRWLERARWREDYLSYAHGWTPVAWIDAPVAETDTEGMPWTSI